MRLAEAIDGLQVLPAAGVIFAERLEGEFDPRSRCEVLELTDEELEQPVSLVAARRAPGLEYFLEVDIAKDLLATAGVADSAAATALLIRYAEHDA